MAASTITRDTLTNDTGTPAAPAGDGTTLNNSVLQNNIYARIDELFSGAGAYTTLEVGGLVKADGFGTHAFSGSGSGGNVLSVRNANAGSTNYAGVNLGNDATASAGNFSVTSSSFVTSGISGQDSLVIEGTRSGGISMAADHASGMIRFYTGGAAEHGRMWPSGGVAIGSTTSDPATGGLSLAGILALGPLTTAAFTVSTNDYNPSNASLYNISSTGAVNLTGWVPLLPGQVLILCNVGSNTITIKHENASSSATNRFYMTAAADISLPANAMRTFIYNPANSRWRPWIDG